MNLATVIITPCVGAAIGYSTNWLAIKMLFRPHYEKRIAGFAIPFTPGLIPRERARISKKIAETVGKSVLTPEVIAKELASSDMLRVPPDITVGDIINELNLRDLFAEITVTPEALTEAAPKVISRIENWLNENPWLDEKISEMVRGIIDENFGRFVGLFIDHKKVYGNIKDGLFAYISNPENLAFALEKVSEGGAAGLLPEPALRSLLNIWESVQTLRLSELLDKIGRERLLSLLEKLAAHIAGNMDIQTMIEEKLNAFTVEEAEALVLGVINRELNVIMALGGVLGFLIGFISLIPQMF